MYRCGLAGLVTLTLLSGPPVLAQPATPEVVCAPDATGARLAIELAFAELQRLHRARVPGPTGQSLVAQRTDKLLARFVHFSRFVDDALGDAWNEAPERRRDWESTISEFLKRRYLDRLGSPLGARIVFGPLVHDCDEAKVSLQVQSPGGKKKTDVLLRLVLEAPRQETDAPAVPPDFGPARWRAFDVAVDGASLLELWKGRFRRVYADGGVAAIEEHLRNLAQRKLGRDEIP
jgi:ABC-type transporter MlaC component